MKKILKATALWVGLIVIFAIFGIVGAVFNNWLETIEQKYVECSFILFVGIGLWIACYKSFDR